MYSIFTVTQWRSNRDSKGRVPTSRLGLGKEYLLNLARISDIVVDDDPGKSRFHFTDDTYDMIPDTLWVNESVANIQAAIAEDFTVDTITLPLHKDNDIHKATINKVIPVHALIFAHDYSAAPTTTSWVVYMEGYHRKEALCNLSITAILDLAASILVDIDGNRYHTVTIGAMEWTIENLRTTRYANGNAIANITGDAEWLADVTGAYCWLYNNPQYKETYGALYNWYAISNAAGLAYFLRAGVQEVGWRVPTQADWDTLEANSGAAISGGNLKEVGLVHWDTPNFGATDLYGFRALAAGNRFEDSEDLTLDGFFSEGVFGDWWTSEEFNAVDGESRFISYTSAMLQDYTHEKYAGMSIRCVR